jgi:hypothetical protein
MAITNTAARELDDHRREQLEACLVEFEQTWEPGRLADYARRLPPGDALRFPALVELVKIDLERNWQRGLRVGVESYLRDHPELGTPDTVPADLLQAEYEVRRQHGEDIEPETFAERFPRRVADLRRLLAPEPTASVAGFSTLRPAEAPSTANSPRPQPGPDPTFARLGRYRIVKQLGRGGMGAVYLAHDTQLDRPVALKVPHLTPDDGPEVRERFFREARAAAALRHPNLCPVYDVGEHEGTLYLTMAYIDGTSLAERVRAGAPLAPAQAAALVRQLALALDVAHRHGVIHRDLKPGNVMVGPDGEPIVMDFGLARRSDKGDVRLTQTGSLLGTPAYMSPEQARGDQAAVGPASDVYSLGAILYELATGALPFSGTLAQVMWQIMSQEPQRPSALRPDLSPQLEAIIMRAMAKKTEDRYPGMSAFAAALTAYLREEKSRAGPVNRIAPYLAPPPDTVAVTAERPRRPARRWAAALALVGGLAVLAVVIVIRYVDKHGKEKTKVHDAAPDTSFVVEDPDGKKLAAGRVPPKPAGDAPKPGPVARGVVAAPYKRPNDWDISPDGRTVVRVYNEDVELWDTATGNLRAKLKAASRDATPVAFSPDSRLVAVGSYRRVMVWDVKDAKERYEFKEPPDRVDVLAFMADGKRLVARGRSGFTQMWDVSTGKALQVPEKFSKLPHVRWYWSPDARTFVLPAGTKRKSDIMTLVHTADLTTEEFDYGAWSRYVTAVSFSGDGKRLLIGHRDNIYTYDLKGKKGKKIHDRHTAKVSSVSLSPDGKLAASGGEDRTAVVWDLEAGKERATYKGFDGPVGVRFSPDGKTLAAWGNAGDKLRRWDVAGGKELPPLTGHTGVVEWVFFVNDGKSLVVGERNKRVTVYDVAGLPQ